jgi:hypothetical protein
MIVATHLGLFMPALRPDWEKCLEQGQPELQVRSRRKIDLLNLRVFMAERGLILGEPFAIPRTDYQWRAYCTRYDWGQALNDFAEDIDYTKFKDTPEKKHGDRKLTEAYGAIWNATLRSFPTGSVYTSPSKGARQVGRNRGGTSQFSIFDEPKERIVETVYRTEKREWRMNGSSPETLAHLMREIDAATADVVLPTDAELAEIDENPDFVTGSGGATEVNGHLDHSKCQHGNSASARRKCRKRFYGRS